MAKLGNKGLFIINVYITPTCSCTGGYLLSLDYLMTKTDKLILGDFNVQVCLGVESWTSNLTNAGSIPGEFD